MSAHEIDRRGARRSIGQEAGPGQRPEQDRGTGEQRQHAEDPDRQPYLSELVTEGDRRLLPGEKIPGRACDRAEGRVRGRADPDCRRRDEHRSGCEAGHAKERVSSTRERFVFHAEGAPSEPEESGGEEVGRRLFDVEPLEDVERRQHDQQHDRELERPAATTPEIDAGDEQQPGNGNRQRMRDAHRCQRLQLQKCVPAPRHVRRERRDQVDDRDQDRADRGKCRQGIRPAKGPEWIRPSVEAELPGGGVAARREEVVPVLRDEPDASESGERRRQVVVDAPEGGACPEREQDCAAQVPLVEPKPGQVQTRPERMSLDADESAEAAIQTGLHPDLIGRTGQRA